MLRYVTFLLFSILANCDKGYHEGHCPPPPELTKDITYNEIAGVWYVVATNYRGVKPGEKECFQGIFTTVNGKYAMRLNYEEPNTGNIQDVYMVGLDDTRKGHFGAKNKDSTGQLIKWEFSLVRFHGDGVLIYACNQVGNTHKTFYEVAVRHLPLNKATLDDLKERYKETSDPRTMHSVNIDDCVWKWHN